MGTRKRGKERYTKRGRSKKREGEHESKVQSGRRAGEGKGKKERREGHQCQ